MNQVLCQLKCQLQHFILLGILLIPFKWNLFEFHNTMINVLFFPLIRLSAKAMDIAVSDRLSLNCHDAIKDLRQIVYQN